MNIKTKKAFRHLILLDPRNVFQTWSKRIVFIWIIGLLTCTGYASAQSQIASGTQPANPGTSALSLAARQPVSRSIASAVPETSSQATLGSEFPKFVYGVLTAVIAALATLSVAAFAGNRITATWDIRKKRGELDVLLTKEFYQQVATFKAIAREWTHLARQRITDTDASNIAAGELLRQALVTRAIAGEAEMEAILLKLVVDLPSAAPDEHARDLHRLALLRIIYRHLRESIANNIAETPPDFRDPELWLLNSIVGGVAEMIKVRTMRPVRIRDSDVTGRPRVDYLQLIAYRTSDYHRALNMLTPRVDAFFHARDNDRILERQANIENTFTRSSVAFVYELQPPPTTPAPPPASTVKLCVETPRKDLDLNHEDVIQAAAERLFQRSPFVQFYLLVADQGNTRVIIFERGNSNPSTFQESDELPIGLPFSVATPVYGITLLKWRLSNETLKRLAAVDVTSVSAEQP